MASGRSRLAKDLNEETKPIYHQEIIDESELQKYLKEGWTFVSTLNSHHAIVQIDQRRLGTLPPHPATPLGSSLD